MSSTSATNQNDGNPMAVRSAMCVPIRDRDVFLERFDDEAVVHVSQTNRLYLLNRTALMVWDACDGRKTLLDLAAVLRKSHEVTAQEAEDHVEQLVVFFCNHRLLQVEE